MGIRDSLMNGRHVAKRTIKEVILMRVTITLACTETGDRNYTTSKNKRTHPQRLEIEKG